MSNEAKQITLAISQIRLDGGTQIREKLDQRVVKEYAERMRAGDAFPPIAVIFDGENHWLADGFHRLHAALLIERTALDCHVCEGTRRDAVLAAVQANATHGLRRTNKDKRRAVETLLADETWSQNSTKWIADTCGVGRGLVEEMRRQHVDSTNSPLEGGVETRLGQDGKLRPAHRTAKSADESFLDPAEAAMQCAAAFDICLKHLREVSDEGKQLAEGPGGTFLSGKRLESFCDSMRDAAKALDDSRPFERCKDCYGDGCEYCGYVGWFCMCG